VRRGDLNADAGLAARHDRVAETNDEYTARSDALEEFVEGFSCPSLERRLRRVNETSGESRIGNGREVWKCETFVVLGELFRNHT